MFLRVFLPSLMALTASESLLLTSTTSAASIATSVPAPIAIPTLALVSAGASLIPSPIIAVRPCSIRLRTASSLPPGRTSAITSSTPTSAAIASAVAFLSPVIITVLMPISRSCLIASTLSSLTESASAITPSSLPPFSKSTGVLPALVNSSVSFISLTTSASGTLLLTMNPAFPPAMLTALEPSHVKALTPPPGTSS